jgi:hypothetical protein
MCHTNINTQHNTHWLLYIWISCKKVSVTKRAVDTRLKEEKVWCVLNSIEGGQQILWFTVSFSNLNCYLDSFVRHVRSFSRLECNVLRFLSNGVNSVGVVENRLTDWLTDCLYSRVCMYMCKRKERRNETYCCRVLFFRFCSVFYFYFVFVI